MRDRLKSLIAESSDKVLSIPYISEDGAEALADYLIAEGVIVAPCKVGDTVYRVMCRGVGDFFIREETVWIVDMHATAGLEIITKFVERKGLTSFKKIDTEDFGKTIFLAREEAEKHLRKGTRDEH